MADATSLISLIVAQLTLLVALLHALQQYSGTADGYRRCQRSVMGNWAKHTLRRFKWRRGEFRFETIFAIPQILLADYVNGEVRKFSKSLIVIDGSKSSRIATMVDEMSFGESEQNDGIQIIENELTTWLVLLLELQNHEECRSMDGKSTPIRPCNRILCKSWDFMPPEVIKPYAISTLHDIILICQFLGLSWKTIDLDTGKLQAEGNGFVVTSWEVRSLGILFSFTEVGKHARNAVKSSQSSLAAAFDFGYIPMNSWAYKAYKWHPNILKFKSHGCFPVAGDDGVNQYFKLCMDSRLEPREVDLWKSHIDGFD